MTQALDVHKLQRLAYVRYLYREGIEQTKQPPPLHARAITSFHDAVENFLGLTAQHLGLEPPKNIEFIAYWALIKPEVELPKREQMRRLNDVRVALKHNGTFPSEHQIEQARQTVIDFLTMATPKVFGVDIESIDMADLVTQAEAKQLLKDAQTHAEAGDYIQAMAGLDLAFKALLRHYRHRDWGSRRGPFDFGDNLSYHDKPEIRPADRTMSRLAKLSEFMPEAQQALRVMSLGIDYPSYVRFDVTTPNVQAYMNGAHRYTLAKSLESTTTDDYDWARHFVIESALRASKADDLQTMMRQRYDTNRLANMAFEERTWTGPAEA